LLQALGYWDWLNVLGIPVTVVLWVILGGVVLWMAVDPRPAIAVAIFIGGVFVESVGPMVFGVQPQFPWLISVYAAGSAVMAAAAIWRLLAGVEQAGGQSGPGGGARGCWRR
jgi:hypothetical protein